MESAKDAGLSMDLKMGDPVENLASNKATVTMEMAATLKIALGRFALGFLSANCIPHKFTIAGSIYNSLPGI